MLRHIDHVTVAVSDLAAARRFFGLLGFEEDKAVVISGPVMDRYMGVEDIEADHVTLVLKGASPRCEVQILHYRRPDARPDPNADRLDRLGYNHMCFATSDIDDMIGRLTQAGVRLRNEPMVFHDRKLVFLEGPEGIVVELAEWR
jgi:catechol 2,3-dioxygenase-like lactoylglutathione lyase family enzyme